MIRNLPIVAAVLTLAGSSAAQDRDAFERAVLPILQAKCLSCHGEKKQRAGLDLRTKSAILAGGESGAALKPGYLADSPLWERVTTDKVAEGVATSERAWRCSRSRWAWLRRCWWAR